MASDRKEIVFLSGRQILIVMLVIGNLMVVALMLRYHEMELFRLENADLNTFVSAQKKEHDVKEAIKQLDGVKSWNETAYAKNNLWSVLPGDDVPTQIDPTAGVK